MTSTISPLPFYYNIPVSAIPGSRVHVPVPVVDSNTGRFGTVERVEILSCKLRNTLDLLRRAASASAEYSGLAPSRWFRLCDLLNTLDLRWFRAPRSRAAAGALVVT